MGLFTKRLTMNEQLEVLTLKLENQINAAFDTLACIHELEETEWPTRHLSDDTKMSLWFIHHSMLMRCLWDRMEEWKLTTEKRCEVVSIIWNATHEHYKELYWHNTKK